jgi:hypothetical protein
MANIKSADQIALTTTLLAFKFSALARTSLRPPT